MADKKKDTKSEAEEKTENLEEGNEEAQSEASEEKKSGLARYISLINPLPFIKNLYVNHKLWFFISTGSLLLLTIIGVVVWWLFLSTPSTSSKDQTSLQTHEYDESYYALPEIKLRMRYDDNTLGYLVIGLTLKTHSNFKTEEIQKIEPEILDALHTYFVSITLDSFSSTNAKGFTSAVALERLRNAILQRINSITAPKKIQNVLFRKLITQ